MEIIKESEGGYLAKQYGQFTGKKEVLEIDGKKYETFPFVITEEVPDRDGDRVKVSGLQTENYDKNNLVFADHNLREEPIGNGFMTRVQGKKMLTNIWFHELDDFSRQQKKYVENGVKKAVSIGFRIFPNSIKQVRATPEEKEKYGRDFIVDIEKAELYEISLVKIPANPEAVAIKSFNKIIEDKMENKSIDEQLDFIIKEGNTLNKANREKLQKVKELVDDVLGSASKELENRIDALEKRVDEAYEIASDLESIFVKADEEIESEEKSELLTSEQILEKFYNNKQEAEDAKDNTND